jgi:hypothetical protein
LSQYQHWSVCQVCGRIVARDSDPDWLDSPSLDHPGYRVIRCPKHWSEWALRKCEAGRTGENRRKLYRLKVKYAHWPDHGGVPFYPLKDEPHGDT